MVCIYCKGETKVTNSRSSNKNYRIWRRRNCINCHARLTTLENYDLTTSLVVKKRNGNLEPFFRDKLLISILLATNHLKEPKTTCGALTDTVLRHLLKPSPINPNLTSDDIANTTLKVLKRYDAASSIKYASFRQNMSSYRDITKSLRNT